jgi:hypothetical protein
MVLKAISRSALANAISAEIVPWTSRGIVSRARINSPTRSGPRTAQRSGGSSVPGKLTYVDDDVRERYAGRHLSLS